MLLSKLQIARTHRCRIKPCVRISVERQNRLLRIVQIERRRKILKTRVIELRQVIADLHRASKIFGSSVRVVSISSRVSSNMPGMVWGTWNPVGRNLTSWPAKSKRTCKDFLQ